jgi:lipopolysaccharide/colanic/teichoic acid biosynthesis glycosyltransferase
VARDRRDWKTLFAVLPIADAIALMLAVAVTGALRLVIDQFLPVVALGYPDRHIVASVLVVPVLLVLFRLLGLYNADRILAGSHEYGQIASAVTYGVLIVLAISFFVGDGPLVSRTWLLLVWVSSIVAVGSVRFATRRIVRQLRQHGVLRTRVAIVGASPFGIAIAQQMQSARGEGLDVVGFLDEYIPVGQPLLDGVCVIGRPGELVRGFGANLADEYVLVPQALPHERLEEITRLMVSRTGPTLRVAVSSVDLLTQGVFVAERASVPLMTVRRARIVGFDAILKRTLDLVGATLALIVLAPFALGTVLHGLLSGRRLFTRSTIVEASGARVAVWMFDRALTARPLVRGVPALLSVLRGRLTLVGPRPVTLSQKPSVLDELRLTAVKPGLTGPWRLSGPSASLRDQAMHDLAYVRAYTIWEDLRILWESLRLIGADRSQLVRWEWEQPGRQLTDVTAGAVEPRSPR